jgi:hypothetical protein
MNFTFFFIRKDFLFLLTGLYFYILFWSSYPFEFIASDPWGYSSRAFKIAEGTFFSNPSDQVFSHRLGVILPTSLFYKLFGVSLITTNLISLISVLIIIITIWLASPSHSSKFFALIFSLCSIALFNASIMLYPDIIATAFMAFSSLLLFKRNKSLNNGSIYRLLPIIATLALFFAFLAKLSAYWVLPLWGMALFKDIKSQNKTLLKRFYLPVFISAIFLGVSYLVIYQICWGNPLARFHNIQSMTGEHLWSWGSQSTQALIDRWTTQPAMLYFQELGVISLLTILALWKLPESLKPWLYYTILTTLFFWFGTTSFTTYQPMPLVSRMILPSLPGFYILTGYFVANVKVSYSTPSIIYNRLLRTVVTLLICLPFFGYLQSWSNNKFPENEAIKIVKKEIHKHSNKDFLLVTSDSRSSESLEFYFGYHYPNNLTVMSAQNLTQELLKSQEIALVFINRPRSLFLEHAYQHKHYDMEILNLNLPAIYQSKIVAIFKTNNPRNLLNIL